MSAPRRNSPRLDILLATPAVMAGVAGLNDPGDTGIGLLLAVAWIGFVATFAQIGARMSRTTARAFVLRHAHHFDGNLIFALAALVEVITVANLYRLASGDGLAFGPRIILAALVLAGLGILFMKPPAAGTTQRA